ncbi:MAG: hypothetical protein ACK5LX_03245 [Oscillospiraceae bacterium]
MSKFFDAIFPMVANYNANKIVRDKMNPHNEAGEDIRPDGILAYIENSDKLTLDMIKEQYEDTFRTKDKLEDKAKTNIIGITISITLIMGASGVLSGLNEKYPVPVLSWILFALFVISVAYMLIAGLLVIRLLTNENEVCKVRLNSLASSEATLRDDYDKCISQNQRKNTIRNNYVFTSYECIRNALVCLFIILVLVAVPFSTPNKDTDKAVAHTVQAYEFVFSSSAVDFIKESEVRDTVEKAIITTVENADLSDVPKTFSIIDDSNNLFIKFEITENSIVILLIESYTPS